MFGTGKIQPITQFASLILLIALVTTCSGGGTGQTIATGLAGSTRDFKVVLWEDSWVDGGTAEVDVRESVVADGYCIELWAERAEGLKALYYSIEYDPRRYAPESASPGELERCSGELLQLAVLDLPGAVHCGQVLANYPDHEGFSGEGLLARISFANGPPRLTRRSSAAPVSKRSESPLAWNATDERLEWGYYCEGDYDQNSETNIADLSPLGLHY
ncbi:MAG TPA: hypothetical protein ENO21_02270, partial [Firmicutes bacterium]|nr:hypothetical protein [Bacillota bacterium]